jgi:serine/threonine-protein kinase
MGEVLKKFGRYFLLDHVAQGGMAEIYRARLASADGAGRLLVIKRIQAGYGANAEFLQMFKSEIKVTMGFNHPNIVQLYDFGEEQNQPYIAMEFVDGKNLRQFLQRFSELKQTFPVELAAYIMEQAASGLHYAHCFKDKISGQPLNIVHRDISPQNILIAYEGSVKVIDFGIAKAATNSESTRAGVIKGKPSYLSPEQISGEPLDGRCDIFALGIVLWELLTGKKLFAGENDLAVLKLIESVNTHVKPPSTLNPKVPKELDYIVLKALAKQREKRYQTGEEMQRALHKFLYAFSPDFNPGDLSYHAKDLFKNEIVEDRKRIQKLNDKVEMLIASDIPEAPKAEDGPAKPERREDTTTIVEQRDKKAAELAAILKPEKIEMEAPVYNKGSSAPRARSSVTSPTAASAPAQVRNASRPVPVQQHRAPMQAKAKGGLVKPLVGAAAALFAIAFFGPDYGISVPVLSELMGSGGGAAIEARLTLQGEATGVIVTINGKPVSNHLPFTLKGIPVGTSFQVAVNGPLGTFQQEVTLRKGEQKTIAVAFGDTAPTVPGGGGIVPDVGGKSIVLRLNVTPGGGGATVTVNGRPVDPNNPVVQVPLDAPLELVAERGGFKPFRREFVLESRQLNGLKEWLMDVQMEPTRFGFLTIRTTPSADATIMIDGKPWVRKTPLENEKVPVGTYSIKLANDVLGMEKQVTVSVTDGRAVTVDERLEIGRMPSGQR